MDRSAALDQARRLAPARVAVDNLAEAIWLRTIAGGGPPGDDEVRAYLRRCAATGRYVAGREEHLEPIRPHESYTYPGGRIELDHRTRQQTGGQASWAARRIGTGDVVASARTRSKVRRLVEERYAGGSWSIVMATTDRVRILKEWDQ